MLQITPDLYTFPLFREFYKERGTQDKQLDLYNGLQAVLSQQEPKFMQTLIQKITKSNKKSKDRNKR